MFKIAETQPQKDRNPDLDASKRFTECLNQTVTLSGFQLVEIGDITFAIMETSAGKISSSGEALGNLLSGMKEKFDAGESCKVRLILKKGKYHYLEDAK